jgi:hypothetical protein
LSASTVAAFVLAGALAFAGAGAARADVAPVNPLTAAPVSVTTKQGQAVTIQLLGSGPVGVQLFYNVGPGFAAVPTAHGSVSLEGGVFSSRAVYTPGPGFSGTDTFTYTVSPNGQAGTSDPATVTVTVVPVAADNHAPTATPISVSVENPPFDGFAATATDPDGDPLIFAVASPPSHGIVEIAPGPNGGTYFYYSPATGYFGPDSFTFTASDGVLTSAPVTASITVVAQRSNTPPTSVPPPTVTTAQDSPVSITLTATDVDGDPIFIDTYNDTQHGTLTGGEDGHLVYTPTLGYAGPDSFHYEVTDHRSTSDTYTVNITVTPAQVPGHTPTVLPVSVGTQGAPVPVTLLGSDPDGDPLTYATAGGPTHGVLTGTGANLMYTPNANFFGTDGFTYTASDGIHVSTPAAVQITVTSPGIPFVFPSVDVSVSADQKQAAAKVVSPELTTTAAERLLVAFVTVDGPTSATQKVSSVTGGGLTWTLVTRSNSTWGTAEIWQAHATSKLTDAVVTAKFAKSGFDGSITVTAFANAAGSVGASAAGSGVSGAPSVTVAPRADGSLIWATGHDWTHAAAPAPLASQTVRHSFLDKRVDDSFWTESFDYPTTNFPIMIGASSPTADRWQLVGVEIPSAVTATLPS